MQISHFIQNAIPILILTMANSPFVWADYSDEDSALDTVTVLGKAYRNTATKTKLEPHETPQAINIVDGETLMQRGVKSLNQALRYVPGTVTETKGSSVNMYDNFYVRGFPIRQAYYDGLPLPYLIGWNLQPQVDPIAMQQIEIFKGPTSVLYGSMSPGGLVNIISKAPQTDTISVFSASLGMRNLMEASFDTTGSIGYTDLSYRVIAMGRKQDSQVNNATDERYLFAPSLNWKITDSTDLTISFYYQNDPSMGINSSLPASGMFIDNPLGKISPSTSAGDLNWSVFKRKMLMAGYKLNHDFNESWSFLQNARYTEGELLQKNTYHTCNEPDNPANCNFNESTGQLFRNIYSTEETTKAFTIDNQISANFHYGSLENDILLGTDYQYLSGVSDYSEYFTLNIPFYVFNVFNPDNDILSPKLLFELRNQKDDIFGQQIGIYLQDQLRFNGLVLLAGGRYDIYKGVVDRSETYVSGFIGGNTEEITADLSAFSYRFGALYEFDFGIAPYLNYATGFEPTPGKGPNGISYKPETSEQWELGIKAQSDDERSNASVSVYRIVKSDALIINPADYRNPPLQVGEITSQGVEVQTQWGVTDSLTLAAGYTYSDIKVTKDTAYQLEGTTPIYVPEHSANLAGNYFVDDGVLAGTRISGGVRYVGEMQMDDSNTQGKVPAYTSVDLSLGYDLGELNDQLTGTAVNVAVTNALDQESYTCFDKTNCWFGAERSVEVKLDYEF
ncbi:TonB-dependent siderophore receptor [Veronia pacifica]|uniref:Ligand-gated channel protein n=1 Tax=Veronia pacifica TaxID=1080227 RepID=A0A1C3ESG7_9GAMM|nr:TonB-dependent siderophore receptor [Veronia pacifica]ODA36169.1 ligand-gated channel protein [Veronia pacifica]